MTPAGVERQRIHPQDRGQLQRSIKMRESIARTCRFPNEPFAESLAIDGDQKQVALAGKMPRRRFDYLRFGRKMDEAVLHIDRRAPEDAFGFRDPP